LVADDLTGACDAASPFARYGLATLVALASGAGFADVLAVSTESRGLTAEESRGTIAATARRLSGVRAGILFKKIDSTLRGNVGTEIAATAEAFGCDAAVITPAFPEMQRVVVDGWLRVDGAAPFEPIELRACLGLDSHRHVCGGAVTAAIGDGVRYVSVDAGCPADLDALVEAVMESPRRILWAGSAGLASALARRVGAERVARRPDSVGPVVFCIGSTHAATVAQRERLVQERDVCALSAETATADEVCAALGGGRHVVLDVPRGRIPEERIAELLRGARALALSGGDTASHVCRALRAHSIELHDEVQAGIPWGTLRGGLLDGSAVATKSGGFGDSGALIAITDFFACAKA
jgi:uncharacterized protein YgbK (DUF1537 family)